MDFRSSPPPAAFPLCFPKANDFYVIHDVDKELLIPAVKSVVQKVDIATKTITIPPR